MARKCKCAITGETGTTDTFVKIGTKYYKNREIYEASQKEKESYKRLIDYICREFLGYGKGQPFPSVLPKKIKELSFYNNDIILQTFKECSSDIHYWLEQKQFSNEYGMISYLFAIVKSRIAEVAKKEKRLAATKSQQNHHQIEWEDLSGLGSKKNGKDISRFLNEDEL